MRVAIVSHYLMPHEGGIEHVVDRLAREYREAGCVTTMVGFSGTGTPLPVAHHTRRLRGWNVLERAGIPVPLVEPASSWWQLGAALSGSDVVHIHGMAHPAAILAMMQCRRLGIGGVLTEHVGTVPVGNPVVGQAQASMLHLGAHLARRSLSTVTVLNDRVQGELAPMVHPLPVLKINNGVDGDLFRPPSEEERDRLRRKWKLDGPTVLAVGRNVAKKNLASLLRAAEMEPGFNVVLVGAGVARLAPSPRLRHAFEWLAQEDLAELYRAVDVFALPSTGEGLPLVVLEALASGLPVVTGDDSAVNTELAGLSVTPVPSTDIRAIHAAVRGHLASDAAHRHAQQDEARTGTMRRFSWSESAHQYLDLLEEAVK